MPKMKTSKTAKKRFKITGSGKYTHLRSTRAHKLISKSKSRKRQFTKDHTISKSETRKIKKLIG